MTALKLAEIIDAFRLIPRLLMLIYGGCCWWVTDWFMCLADPTAPQAALVATIWGAAAAWFGFYTKTGRTWT